MKKIKAQPKPSDENKQPSIQPLIDFDDTSEDFPIEKEEQALAQAIIKLTNTDPEVVKILSEISNIPEAFALIKMIVFDKKIKNMTKKETIYNGIPLTYLKLMISKDRQGRKELVEITRRNQKEDEQNRMIRIRKIFGGSGDALR